jgi:hypothetical protein
MTNTDTEPFIRALREVRMPSFEREAMRHTLIAYAQTYQPRPAAFAFFMRHGVAYSALALVLVAGTTAVTAHDALPGNPLYGVKTAVTDRIALATAPDDAARLDIELGQIERALVDEERALAQEEALRDEPTLSPQPTDDGAEGELRDLERELNDLERDAVPTG